MTKPKPDDSVPIVLAPPMHLITDVFTEFARSINRAFAPPSHVQFLIRTGEYIIARKAGR